MPGARSLAMFAEKMSVKYKEKVSNGPPPVIVRTGSLALDYALRVGGWQTGRIYEVIGPRDGGKTSLAIASMVSFLETFPGKGVAYVNMENTFDPARAALMGLGCSQEAMESGRWAPLLPDSSEAASDMARDYCGSGVYSLVVVDSIGAMESRRVLEKDAEKAADSVARNAKIITQMSKALSSLARLKDCTVLLINQPRASIGMPGAPDVSAGPKAMQHSTTGRIEMRALGGEGEVRTLKMEGEDGPFPVSHKTRMRVTRLKNGPPGRVATTWLNRIPTSEYGPPGIDTADESVTWGIALGAIRQAAGGNYTLPGGEKICGRIALLQHVRQHPELAAEIRAAVPFDAPVSELPPPPFELPSPEGA